MRNLSMACARIIAALLLVLASSARAHAEEPRRGSFQLSLDRAIAAAAIGTDLGAQPARVRLQSSSPAVSRSAGRKIAGGVVGAVGGFFGGGFLGAAIEGNRCDCDDPGLMGFIIGAPIGAAIGGLLGAKFLF